MKLIRLLIVICCLPVINGCASFGKGVAQAFIEKEDVEDTRICQIRGRSFQGLAPRVKDTASPTKVLMVHGVGHHIPGYSTQLLEKLAVEMELEYISEVTKNIALTDPRDNTKELGNLRINRLTNKDKTHELLFYELTWSEITAEQKSILAYDNSGEYSFRRATVNNQLKKFTNDTAPDPMIYLGASQKDILLSFSQSFCWMTYAQWDDLPVTTDQACTTNSSQLERSIENIKKDSYTIISHSLGSRITLDGLQRIASVLDSDHDELDTELNRHQVDKFVGALKEKKIAVYMLSNQLPLLQLGRKLPEFTGQRSKFCRADGEQYQSRLFNETKIIAFSDPNDILSYAIPNGFVEKYLDSRLCVKMNNVNINVAKIIEVFGVDMANPFEAHVAYDTDERVIALLANGVGNKNTAPIIKEKCEVLVTLD